MAAPSFPVEVFHSSSTGRANPPHLPTKGGTLTNPIDKIKLLRDAIDRVVEDSYFKRIAFSVNPGDESEPDNIIIIFEVDSDILKSEDQIKIDNEFDSLIAGIAKDKISDKKQQEVNKHIEDLKEWLNED